MATLEPVDVGRRTFAGAVNPELTIKDVTLREGEQAAEVNFSLQQKLMITDRLVDAGVTIIQGGYPGRSKVDREFIETLKKVDCPALIEAIVQIYTKDWREQVDIAVESGADIINLMYPVSDLRLDYVQKVSREEALKQIAECIPYAVEKGIRTRFSPTDATRAHLPFLMQSYETAVNAGATDVGCSDTAGCMTPEGVEYLVSMIMERFDVTVHLHCHNDFGLALANCLAGVKAGASIIDASINGLGERAGNVDMAQAVTSLQHLYKVDLGVDMTKLTGLSQIVAELSGMNVPDNYPLTGKYAFSHKLDAHVYGLEKNPEVYEFIAPQAVGNKTSIPLGKYTGPYVTKKKLKEIGLKANDAQIDAMINQIHELSIENKCSVSDDEFAIIAREVMAAAAE
jgi:2-isopropylmalate synthase